MRRASLEHLRSRILASLGLSMIGCGGSDAPLDEEAGVTTDPSGGNSASSGESGTTGGTSTSTSTSTSTEPGTSSTSSTSEPGTSEDASDTSLKFDLPPEPDIPPLGDCTVTATDSTPLMEHPDCTAILDEGCGIAVYVGCVEPEPGQTCERLCTDGDCIPDWLNCAGDPIYDLPAQICGPYEQDGLCCSIAQLIYSCTDGRPFVVGSRSRRASLHAIERPGCVDATRFASPARFAGLAPGLRRRLAARWAAIAQAEHASIASFATFTAQLVAIAAPPELIRDALAAASDEVRHSQAALALASAFEGRSLGFGPLDVHAALGEPIDLASLVRACVREGCVGETLAALELGVLARECDDPELAALLVAIGEDELRHAELAWRFVKWALDRQPELRAMIADSFASSTFLAPIEVAPLESSESSESPSDRQVLRSLGCLPADERRQVELEGMRELLGPCAAALLAA